MTDTLTHAANDAAEALGDTHEQVIELVGYRVCALCESCGVSLTELADELGWHMEDTPDE